MRRVAAVVVLGSIMSVLDATVVNVALNTLHLELHSPVASIQWVVTGYMLALAAVIPITGWAARRFGERPLYLAALVGFTATSVLCAVAWSADSLIAFRVLQGLAGGMLLPVGQMILARAAGPARMGRVFSVIGIPIVLAPVLGPVVGGMLIDNLGWRWIFLINLPIGILAVAAAARLLPRSQREDAGPVDARGFALLAVALPAVVYGLAEIGAGEPLVSAKTLLPLLVGLVLVGAFVLHALRVERPLLDVRLWANSAFSAASSTAFCLGAVLFGAMILLPLYYQQVRGEDALQTGLLMAPQGIGVAFAMPLSGRLTDRFGGGLVALAGILGTVLTTLPLTLIGASTSYTVISAVLLVRGFAMGFAIMPAFSAAYVGLRRDQIRDASPQLNVVQRVGGSLGTALFAVLLERLLRTAPPTAAGAADAFGQTYWWVTGVTAVAVVPAVILARVERRRRAEPAEEAAGAVVEPVGEGAVA